MSYKALLLPNFEKQLKRLAKKYPSLQKEYVEFVENIKINPQQGDPLGHNCFKIRLAIASKGKGKSGGARVITCVKIIESSVYLLTIYDKSEKENITQEELLEHIKNIPNSISNQ